MDKGFGPFDSRIEGFLDGKLGGDAEEVGTIFPILILLPGEAKVGLVEQGGGLEGVAGALAAHVAGGEAAEFVKDDGRENFEGGFIALTPLVQKYGNLFGHRFK